MFKVKVGENSFSISVKDLKDINISKLAPQIYQIRKDNINHNFHLEVSPTNPKIYTASYGIHKFELEIMDTIDQQVDEMGLTSIATHITSDVIAPMPGLILDIMVKEGQEITEGDSLLILEAMKMENVIKAIGPGIVKSINKKISETVDKGELIIEIESI